MKSELIFVSYASGMPGFSPSEWIEDKIQAALDLGYRVTLITSFGSQLGSKPGLSVIKIKSLSSRDFQVELNQSRFLGSSQWPAKVHRRLHQILGKAFDALATRVLGQHSDGRYSWAISALPRTVFEILKKRPSALLATGGPSGAQVAAVLAGMLTGQKPVLEFQDPFIGSEMRLTPRSEVLIRRIETFLVKHSQKTVFVTNAAANSCRIRNPELGESVSCIYPGAYNRLDRIESSTSPKLKPPIRLVHLGTLYGSRNLETLFSEVDRLLEEGLLSAGDLQIENIGAAYLDDLQGYRNRPDFTLSTAVDRLSGLTRSSSADYLLLVQHSDSRSLETIPFKFYDYQNVGKPIFLLHNNSELRDLVNLRGGIMAHINKPTEIRTAILQAVNSKNHQRPQITESHPRLSAHDQLASLLGLSRPE